MKNRIKSLGAGAIVAVGLLVVGCTTTTPVMYTDTANKEFTVLGEVTYESKDNLGFSSFLAEARKQYPDTDYIVDIMVDEKVTTFLFWKFKSQTYRGTAISYR